MLKQLIKPLTRDGAKRLVAQINELGTDMCKLLQQAKDGRAWEALGYDSWGAFVAEEIGMTRQHANQLLSDNSLRNSLKINEGVEGAPSTSGAALREIKKLPPEKRAEAVATASKAGKVTAKSIKAVVDAIQPPPSRSDGLAELAAAAEDAERENERLRRLNESLSATDAGAAIVKLNGKYEAVNGRVNQLLETESKMRSEIKYRDGILDKVRKMLRVESNARIVPALEALLKEVAHAC
jgi:hypothetical protein